MSAPDSLPDRPRAFDLSFVRQVKKGRRLETCYFHPEPMGDDARDFERGIGMAVEYLDYLRAGGTCLFDSILSDALAAQGDPARRWAAYGLLHILRGCLNSSAMCLDYRGFAVRAIEQDRQSRAYVAAWYADRKRKSRKRACATRQAKRADRQCEARIDESGKGVCHG